MEEYIKSKSDVINTTTKEINSSFLKNISNITLNKKDKLKLIMLSVIDKRMKVYFKNTFLKWKNMPEEIQEKQNYVKINLNFFDSCLSLNLKNNEVIDNDINNINDNNINNSNNNINTKKSKDDIINNNSLSNKKNEIIENINFSKDKDKENNIIKKDIIIEKSMDFEENLFPKYNEVNNNSIAMDENNLDNQDNPDENIKINNDNKNSIDNNDNNHNNLNENIKDINDDFDVKLSEEIILNSKDNLKLKSDIFDSNDLNDSLNDNINNNENNIDNDNDMDKCDNNNNICNLSTGKDMDGILKKEKEEFLENNNNDAKIENNEICNFFNIEKETIKNAAQSNIKESIEKDKKDDIELNKEFTNNNNEKNILNNEDKIVNINNSNNNDDDENKVKEITRNEFGNDKMEISNEINNKDSDKFYDSLEHKNLNPNQDTNIFNADNKKVKNNIKNKNSIQNNKKKILSQFLSHNSTYSTNEKTENVNKKKNCNTPKKYSLQISETNNIFLNNTNNNNKNDIDIEEYKKMDSFTCTNQARVENIFIKGEKIKSKFQNNTENRTKKNLELFISNKNNDILLKHNNNNKKNINTRTNKKMGNNYNYMMEGNHILNNIENRLIDSNMIMNFLNNSKNERMLPNNIIQNNQSINTKLKINHNRSIISKMPSFKTNKNIHSNKNKNININFNSFKNFLQEKKNHFYLKKPISKTSLNNENTKNTTNNMDNLDISEVELIEPNIQICPVTKAKMNENNDIKELNNICEKISNGNMVENLLQIKKNKNPLKIHKKLPKSLSSEFIDNKTINKHKYNTLAQNINGNGSNNLNYKYSSISNDLLDFINNLKKKEESKIRISNFSTGDIYNYSTIKYDKYNTYREKKNKNNTLNNKNRNRNRNSVINSLRRTNSMVKIDSNNNIKNYMIKENKCRLGNNKKRNVDYKRLNELYLDYKINDIKRNQLKKEQDLKRGITFIPHINKIKK